MTKKTLLQRLDDFLAKSPHCPAPDVSGTDPAVVEDAKKGMLGLGMKPGDVLTKIEGALAGRTFTDPAELIREAFKR